MMGWFGRAPAAAAEIAPEGAVPAAAAAGAGAAPSAAPGVATDAAPRVATGAAPRAAAGAGAAVTGAAAQMTHGVANQGTIQNTVAPSGPTQSKWNTLRHFHQNEQAGRVEPVTAEVSKAAQDRLLLIVASVIGIGLIAAYSLRKYKCEWLIGGFCGAVLIECYRASYTVEGTEFEHTYHKVYKTMSGNNLSKARTALDNRGKDDYFNMLVVGAIVTAFALILAFGNKK
jgi:hypothetical protein